MFKKMLCYLVTVGVAGSLVACGKSVEAQCEELVDSLYATQAQGMKNLGMNEKDMREATKDMRAAQVKACVLAKK